MVAAPQWLGLLCGDATEVALPQTEELAGERFTETTHNGCALSTPNLGRM